MTVMDSMPPPAGPPAIESLDVFTPEEAQRYLKIPTRVSFDQNRQRMQKALKVKLGRKFGRVWRYSREELDELRRFMFGLDGPPERPGRSK